MMDVGKDLGRVKVGLILVFLIVHPSVEYAFGMSRSPTFPDDLHLDGINLLTP